MTKPTIIIVPGSFSLPTFYSPIIYSLTEQGFPARAIPLLSVGRREGAPPATMAEDAASVHAELEKLADEGKEIVVIGHSYGGIPVSEAQKGLSLEERRKEGKKGGVVRLGYLTAFVPPVGISCATSFPPNPNPETQDTGRTVLGEDGYLTINVEKSAPIVLNDVPIEEAKAFVSRFPPHSGISFAGELTYPGYKYIPSSYLLCEKDLTIVPELQRAQIENIKKETGKEVDVYTIDTGHAPNVSAPEKVVEWILHVVKQIEG